MICYAGSTITLSKITHLFIRTTTILLLGPLQKEILIVFLKLRHVSGQPIYHKEMVRKPV
jgi:hypothetical protein